MTLDKEEHRAILLELIGVAHFPGNAARVVVELTEAIEQATVESLNEIDMFAARREASDTDGALPTRS